MSAQKIKPKFSIQGSSRLAAKIRGLAGFCIDPGTGLLSAIGLFQTDASPRSFAVDPHGLFLICAGQDKNTVGVYAIAPR